MQFHTENVEVALWCDTIRWGKIKIAMIIDDFKKLVIGNKDIFITIVYGLFTDSIRCFEAGIYRQAYLLSYQGLTQHLRRIVLDAEKPSAYDQHKWDGVIAKLNNEKEFDDQVFKCIQQKNDPTATPPVVAILDVPEFLREDILFWRRRRM